MVAKIKVIYLVPGIPHYFKDLMNHLQEQGKYDIVCIRPKGIGKAIASSVFEVSEDNKFRIAELEEKQAWYGKSVFKGLKKFVRSENPDIILCGWPYIISFVFDIFLLRLVRDLNIKLICREIPFNIPYYGKEKDFLMHQGIFNEKRNIKQKFSWKQLLKLKLTSIVRKKYYNLCDHLIFYIDEAIPLLKSYGVDENKISVAYNTPDTNILLKAYEEVVQQALILEENAYRLIHVGRLVKWKRVDMLIQAVDILKDKYGAIELIVVGFGEEEEALKEQVKQLNLQSKIQFVGGVYDSLTLGQYLCASSIYVIAGMGGLSINDAMCFAKPIICSQADGTEKHLVREGYNGLYFDNGNLEDLVRSIDELLSDRNKLLDFGRHSQEIIKQEVNIDITIKKYIEAFDSLLN